MSVECPFDCEYLREARLHERLPELSDNDFPNQDIKVGESFLREHEGLLIFLASTLLQTSLSTPGAIDFDVREALDSLIRTYRTLQSGLVYESMPQNPLAAGIHQHMQEAVQEMRQRISESGGMRNIRDAEVLGLLAFLQRLEIQHNNGRRRGRAFLDFLSTYFLPQAPPPGQKQGPRLIVP